jgi:hypothetical protein
MTNHVRELEAARNGPQQVSAHMRQFTLKFAATETRVIMGEFEDQIHRIQLVLVHYE